MEPLQSETIEWGVRQAIQNSVADGTLGSVIETAVTDAVRKVLISLARTGADVNVNLIKWAQEIDEA